MKYNLLNYSILSAILYLSLTTACKKPDEVLPVKTNTTVKQDTIIILEDTLSREWEVKSATHNGSPDPSSVGLKLSINKNGSYILLTTSYLGTWEFIENKTKILLDKADPSYKTTWTIVSISSKKLYVKFKSPFTGGSVEWWMVAY